MKQKKTTSNVIDIRETVKAIVMQNVTAKDVIRMKFLEQSARYLGVYEENTPACLLGDRVNS